MARKRHIVQEILGAASNAGEFKLPEETGMLERYQRFLSSYIESYEKDNPTRLRKYLLVFEAVLMAIGAALGFFIIYGGTEDTYKATIWIAYVAAVSIVSITLRLIPETLETFYLHAQRIRLTNLAERLAAEVALFDLLGNPSVKDDEAFIKGVSRHLPPLSDLSERDTSIIKSCLDVAKVFDSSRETNITFKELNLHEKQEQALFDATRRIVDLCSYLFAGKDFTAKLYLRGITEFQGKNIEILTSFAKYPADTSRSKGRYGSSWIKARGNPSQVWNCLENGKEIHQQGNTFGSYYNSMLLICLPGRVGVLAITSRSDAAFKNKYDKWLIKSLAIAMRTLTAEALELGG